MAAGGGSRRCRKKGSSASFTSWRSAILAFTHVRHNKLPADSAEEAHLQDDQNNNEQFINHVAGTSHPHAMLTAPPEM
eukprot:1162143-Pelagomonas_calceolata.AAC.19